MIVHFAQRKLYIWKRYVTNRGQFKYYIIKILVFSYNNQAESNIIMKNEGDSLNRFESHVLSRIGSIKLIFNIVKAFDFVKSEF